MFAVSLALLADAFPGAKERAGALAAYGATIGASFAIGPLVGGALTSGLDWQWIFLVNIPLGIACIWITRAHVRESRDPRARRVDVPGQVALGAGLFLLVLALLRGNDEGWGEHADRRRPGRRRGPARRVRRDRAPRRGADAPARAVPQPELRRRAGRGARDLGHVLRDLPVPHAVPAAGARAVRDRGRPRLPARDDRDLRGLGRDERAGREDLRPRHDRRRARARRDRHGPHDDRRDRLAPGRSLLPGFLVAPSAPGSSTRRSPRSRSARPRSSRAASRPA